MRAFRAAMILLSFTLIFVIINSVILEGLLNATIEELDKTDIKTASTEDYVNLYEKFKRRETFISLTVSHEDLTNAEAGFAEIIGLSLSGDREAIISAKYRLTDSLHHVKRLSGINLDSIF